MEDITNYKKAYFDLVNEYIQQRMATHEVMHFIQFKLLTPEQNSAFQKWAVENKVELIWQEKKGETG